MEIWFDTHNLLHYVKHITDVKESVYLYIDDKVTKLNGNYDEISGILEAFQPYRKSNLKRIK